MTCSPASVAEPPTFPVRTGQETLLPRLREPAAHRRFRTSELARDDRDRAVKDLGKMIVLQTREGSLFFAMVAGIGLFGLFLGSYRRESDILNVPAKVRSERVADGRRDGWSRRASQG